MAESTPTLSWVVGAVLLGISAAAALRFRRRPPSPQRDTPTRPQTRPPARPAPAVVRPPATAQAPPATAPSTNAVAELLRTLGMSAAGQAESELSPTQLRALRDWNDKVYIGRELAPPTERMQRALRTLGFANIEATPYRLASAVLSARDYASTLADRTAEAETLVEIRALMAALAWHDTLHDKLIAWSWQTANQDPRRIPRDALRTWAEEFLRRFPTPP